MADQISINVFYPPTEINYPFKTETTCKLNQMLEYFKKEGQIGRQQFYGILDIITQRLYKGEELEKTLQEIYQQQTNASLNILEVFEPQQDIKKTNQEQGNTIKIIIILIETQFPFQFILEINRNANFQDIVEKLYSYLGLKREQVNFELFMGQNALFQIGENKQLQPIYKLSIEDFSEIKVKKNWLKQNIETQLIKIKVKLVDGNNSQSITIQIDQNKTLEQFVEQLYGHLGHQKDVVEFVLFMGDQRLYMGEKALKPLFEILIQDNTEIVVKRQWKGGAVKKTS